MRFEQTNNTHNPHIRQIKQSTSIKFTFTKKKVVTSKSQCNRRKTHSIKIQTNKQYCCFCFSSSEEKKNRIRLTQTDLYGGQNEIAFVFETRQNYVDHVFFSIVSSSLSNAWKCNTKMRKNKIDCLIWWPLSCIQCKYNHRGRSARNTEGGTKPTNGNARMLSTDPYL